MYAVAEQGNDVTPSDTAWVQTRCSRYDRHAGHSAFTFTSSYKVLQAPKSSVFGASMYVFPNTKSTL